MSDDRAETSNESVKRLYADLDAAIAKRTARLATVRSEAVRARAERQLAVFIRLRQAYAEVLGGPDAA